MTKAASAAGPGFPKARSSLFFGGNVGAGAHVEGLIEALSTIERDDLCLVIAGDGPKLESCRGLVQTLGARGISFWSPWADEDTSLVLRGADVLVLPTRGSQTEASVPSKLMTYMLAGRPIIVQAASASETARVVNECACGWVVKPDDVQGLSVAIAEASNTPEIDRNAMGQRARQYALANFAADVCLPKVIEIIEQVGEGKKR